MDTMTPGMKKVLAEIDHETDVIDDLWRHARETKYGKVKEEHTKLWSLLQRITKQRFEPGLAARQGIVIAK